MAGQNTILLIPLLICLTTFGCATTNQNQENRSVLSKNEVVRIAEEKANSAGIDLQKYNMTGCHYEFTRKDHTWTVFFEMKPPTPPGGHFVVWVDDRTKMATLMYGE